MPRKTTFYNDGCYHIFNRGVDKREIFSDDRDYARFLLSMDLLNDEEEGLMLEWRDFKQSNPLAGIDDFLKRSFRKRKPLIEILAYCLNPNHYHLILKQLSEKGVEKFLHKVGVSHTKYYNNKYSRSGSLFQGVFKSVHIDSNDHLLYLSAYVNGNSYIHGYSGKNSNWPYSSLPAYLGLKNSNILNSKIVLEQFKDIDEYKEFVSEMSMGMKKKKIAKKYFIEE